MFNNRKMHFGIVGAGMIAQTYTQAFQQSQLARVAAVADLRKESADMLGKTLGCQSFACFREMVDAVPLDAVVVCTPPATHADICIWLANRGIHVLCEKPLTVNMEAARRMFRAAKRNAVELTMASKFRYVEDVSRAKTFVNSGVIGDPVLFENVFTAHVDMASRWNSDPAISGGGVLIDNGTHSVDIMRFFLGPLAELQVVEGKRLQSMSIEDTVQIFIRSTRGVIGSIDLSWSIDKNQPYYVSIYGSEGSVHVGWRESKYRRVADNDEVVFGKGYDKVRAFCAQIDNFVGFLRGQEASVITSEDSLASVAVVEAAYAAMEQSSWVPIRGAKTTVAYSPLSLSLSENKS